jgi:hypothetical protein
MTQIMPQFLIEAPHPETSWPYSRLVHVVVRIPPVSCTIGTDSALFDGKAGGHNGVELELVDVQLAAQ